MIPITEPTQCRGCGVELDINHRGELVPHICCYCADAHYVRTKVFASSYGFGKAVTCPKCQ